MFLDRVPAGERVLLYGGVLADVKKGCFIEDSSVLVEDGKILLTGMIDAEAISARKIPLNGGVITPGLIDAHVHLGSNSELGFPERMREMEKTELYEVIKSNLNRNMTAGVTTVRDLGGPEVMLDLLKELGNDSEVYPTVATSGPVLTIKDGHGHTFGHIVDEGTLSSFLDVMCGKGIDIIKIIGTGGYSTAGTDLHGSQFTDETFQMIMREADGRKMPTACHVHGLHGIRQCLRFGVGTLEHASYMDEETVYEMSEMKKSAWVPTVCPGRLISGLPESAVDRVEYRRSNLRLGIKLGMPILAGTDAGIVGVVNGCLPHELDEFMDAGMSSLEALAAATIHTARVMGIESRKGAVEPGMDADLLVFNCAPDRMRFHDPALVMKGGCIITVGKSMGGQV